MAEVGNQEGQPSFLASINKRWALDDKGGPEPRVAHGPDPRVLNHAFHGRIHKASRGGPHVLVTNTCHEDHEPELRHPMGRNLAPFTLKSDGLLLNLDPPAKDLRVGECGSDRVCAVRS